MVTLRVNQTTDSVTKTRAADRSGWLTQTLTEALIALQPYSPTALQPYSPTALQPYSPTALQPYSPTAL
jgi:hypothetical protein